MRIAKHAIITNLILFAGLLMTECRSSMDLSPQQVQWILDVDSLPAAGMTVYVSDRTYEFQEGESTISRLGDDVVLYGRIDSSQNSSTSEMFIRLRDIEAIWYDLFIEVTLTDERQVLMYPGEWAVKYVNGQAVGIVLQRTTVSGEDTNHMVTGEMYMVDTIHSITVLGGFHLGQLIMLAAVPAGGLSMALSAAIDPTSARGGRWAPPLASVVAFAVAPALLVVGGLIWIVF